MASSSAHTATLAICSSFSNQCKISNHHCQSSLLFSPKTHFSSFYILSSLKLSFSPLLSKTPTFGTILKSSDSDAAVVEAEPDDVEPVIEIEAEAEVAPVVEVANDKPKREEIFAVVIDDIFILKRLKGANVNDKIVLDKVLLVGTKTTTYIGKPVVTNAAVHAVVEEQGLNPKVVVFKYKKKKNYRRNIGHRQPNTRIRITGITGYQDHPAVTLNS